MTRQVTPRAAGSSADELAAIRLGFARGVSPSKWAERWALISPHLPLELVPLGFGEIALGRNTCDMVLERVQPGTVPEGCDPANRTRHGIRLYEEAVALVVAADHELAAEPEVSVDELALVTLLDHPDHQAGWSPAKKWKDESWMPRDAQATVDLVATGAGGALLPLPLARHLTGKRTHAVISVADPTLAMRGTEIWATWALERDAEDVQRLAGVLRGRTPRSSR